MTLSLLKYSLTNGFIDNWLVAGPLAIPIPDLNPETQDNLELTYIQQHFDPDSGVILSPVDLGSLGPVSEEHPLCTWQYHHCREDHYIDFSAFFPVPVYLKSWAFTRVEVSTSQETVLRLTTNGPADVWLNGQHLHRTNHFSKQFPLTVNLPATFNPGSNELLIRFENVGIRETAYVAALEIEGFSGGVEIVIPTEIEEDYYDTRLNAEKVIEGAYLDRYVYGYQDGDRYGYNEPISLNFMEHLDTTSEISVRMQSLHADIFQEVTKKFGPSSNINLAAILPLRNGPHHLAFIPPADIYYLKNIRLERKELFHIVRTPFSMKASSDIRVRKNEAMEDAAERRNDSLFCEIARISLGRWDSIEKKNINAAQNRITQCWDGSAIELLGFIGMLLRFRKKPLFRKYIKAFKPTLVTCITGYRYWKDAPRSDWQDYSVESRQILFHACEILAGQLFPEQTFKVTGMTGNWHKTHGEELAVTWLQQRGKFGFTSWDSPSSLETIFAALSHLVDLADSQQICELASVLMDKIFFNMAINSFKGSYGSSRGLTDTASVLSSRLEATSGISRIMWGYGNLNEAVAGQVSLALCQNYKLPEVIQKIALDPMTAFWSREQNTLPLSPDSSPNESPWKVNKVAYRTVDYLLCSAQDYYPGRKGHREHIWQATLGPDAIVYVNHPICLSEDDSHQPNLWAGNGVLPRVAQWGDVLISVHQLPQDDWLGFTHAYFPVAAFDEYVIQDTWAFARKGDAYLALGAKNKLAFIQSGPTAYRELRSVGNENIWICQMGQKLLDCSFVEFQRKILAMEINFEGLSVHLTGIRNEQIIFGWEGPLIVNHIEQPLSNFRHFENVYCATDLPAEQMDIIFQGSGIRLEFS